MARKKTDERPEPQPEPMHARRVQMRRRAGMAFSRGNVSQSSQGGGVAADPNDDHPDLDLNERVQQRASRPAAVVPAQRPAPQQGDPMDPAQGGEESLQSISNRADFTPAERLRQVGRRSSEYEREYRLSLLSRMLMRRIPLDEIAQQLGISMSQVTRDRAELSSRLREAAKALNIDEMVGNNMDFYDEVMAMAMRAASNAQSPLPMRLAAMRTALASRNDMHRFFQAAGVYDVLRFRRQPGGEGASDIQRMLSTVEDLMSEDRRAVREASTPNPLGDFSGPDTENMELDR